MKVAGLFAEGAHGPMHMGRAVTVEGEARFDTVALVYYPDIDSLQGMLQSTFFNDIVGGQQLGDTLVVRLFRYCRACRRITSPCPSSHATIECTPPSNGIRRGNIWVLILSGPLGTATPNNRAIPSRHDFHR